MKRLKELSQRVKTVLEENESARDNDNILYLHVLKSYGEERGLNIEKMSVPMLLLHCKDMGLPTLESTGRARRKVQAMYPELRDSDDAQAIRILREREYRRFVEGVHYV